MTTIPRMIVLRRQDSRENDPQDDRTPTCRTATTAAYSASLSYRLCLTNCQKRPSPSFPHFPSLSPSTDAPSLSTTLILASAAHPLLAVAFPHRLYLPHPCCLSPPSWSPQTFAAPPHSCCPPTSPILPLAAAASPQHFRLVTQSQRLRLTHPNTRHPTPKALPQAARTSAGVAATDRPLRQGPAAGAAAAAGAAPYGEQAA